MRITMNYRVALTKSDILANGSFIVELSDFDEEDKETGRIVIDVAQPENLIDLGLDLIEAGKKLRELSDEFPSLDELFPPLSRSETQQGGYADDHNSEDAG